MIQASREQVRNAIITSTLPGKIKYRPDEIALVEEKFAFDGPIDPAAKVRIMKIAKSSMEIQVETANPAFLVVSDVYYPGWTAKFNTNSLKFTERIICFADFLFLADQVRYRWNIDQQASD